MKAYIAVPATLALIYRAHSHNSLTPLGIVAAIVTAIAHSIHPWSAPFALLITFFIGGTAVTKVKHDVKARLTLTSSGTSGGEGARTHVQVLANSIVATVLILLHARQLRARDKNGTGSQGCWPYGEDLLVVGIVTNYAAVAADTFSSELGIISSGKPRLITSPTLREVPPGTNGGVTGIGILAGFLGSFTIALTSAVLLPFCAVEATSITGKLLGENQPGFEGGSGWGWREKLVWVGAITLWGGLGSLLDSLLGGWLQASVVDARTGKVIEGVGGKKVPVTSSDHGLEKTTLKRRVVASKDYQQSHQEPRRVSTAFRDSRKIETGSGILDNNSVNFLMALVMSIGGMVVASWYWKLPLRSILQT